MIKGLKVSLAISITLVVTLHSQLTKACDRESFDIQFNSQGQPLIELTLNDKRYLALVDLGSPEAFHFSNKILQGIKTKEKTGNKIKATNILGEVTEVVEYRVSNLSAGCFFVRPTVNVLELAHWDASVGDKDVLLEHTEVIIGRSFFEDGLVAIDYKNNKLELLSREVISPEAIKAEYEMTELSLTSNGIEINLTSEKNDLNMVLDTGASTSILAYYEIIKTDEELSNCNVDFGPNLECKQLKSKLFIGDKIAVDGPILFPIDSRFTADGLLGSDFFRKHRILLDLSKNKLYMK